ncbi:hypothetical protein B0H10DRAFT_2160757 [Mycena sp. CBHHK59/15]|nr:hypothetical protein B0H10DRAFT_2160757 [Mycena sp. CBHHK59/15]
MATPVLAGKTCIVTGGAGGLGKAIAETFLEAGANVVICDFNENLLLACAAELQSKGSLHAVKADVTDQTSIEGLVSETISKFGTLDFLINNAGIMDRFDSAGECDPALWDKVIAVNLTAPFALTRLAVQHMLQQTPSSGVIVNIGSLSSLRGATAGVAYTASKHGLMGLTKNTAASYGKQGIRCNIILPAGMMTNIGESMMRNGINQDGFANMQKAMFCDTASYVVDTRKVGKMCVHLCTDDGSNFNGAAITIDNGLLSF